jgi:plasmid maintenance system antidote protein VapI
MKPVHPGRILKPELVARELSANKLALALRVPSGRITSILNGKRAMFVQLRHFSSLSPGWPDK